MAKYTAQELQEAIETLEAAGKTESASVLRKQLQSVQLHQPRNNGSDSSKSFGNAVDLAKGLKSGFDKAAYAVADLTPDLPISDETRDGWNNNLLVKALGIAIPDREQRQEEMAAGKQEADRTTLGGAGRFVGEIAPAVAAGPSTAGAGLLRAGLTQGALGYLTTPGDTATRSASAALAATGEGVGRFAAKVLARGAQPIVPNPSAQRLIDQGNLPTPGAAVGPASKKMEESLASMPGAGAYINRAFKEGMSDANRIAMEQGGLKVTTPGMVGQRELAAQIDDLYKEILPRISFDIQDPAFIKGVDDIIRQTNLDKKGAREIRQFIANKLDNLGIDGKQPRQLLSGKDLQSLLEEVQENQAMFAGTKGSKRRIAKAYKKLADLIDDVVEKQPQNPADAIDAYRNLRRTYALTVPAMKAGERSTAMRKSMAAEGKSTREINSAAPEGGIFTPAGYYDALTANARSRGRISALRQGKDPLQRFANDFEEVYGNRYQDSGTATRAALTSLALGLGGYATNQTGDSGYLGNTLGSLAALGILSKGAYSPMGRKFLLGQYAGQKQIADFLRKMAPASGTAGAALLPANIEEQ